MMNYGTSKPSWAEPRRMRPRAVPLRGPAAVPDQPAAESSLAADSPAPALSGYTMMLPVDENRYGMGNRPMTLMDIPASYFYAFMILVVVALWIVANSMQRGCYCMCRHHPKITTAAKRFSEEEGP